MNDDTIHLGALTDSTGPYAALGSAATQGNRAAIAAVNQAGGVCDRKLDLEVRDHGYNAQNAVAQYSQIAPNVVGLVQVVGGAMVSAIDKQAASDNMLLMAPSGEPPLLNKPHVMMVGATYDVEVINGLSWLMSEGKLEEGDTLGHIYVDGGYGQPALLGSKFMAEEHDLKLIEQAVEPTATDLTSQVLALKKADVDAIAISTGPAAVGSAVGVAAAQGVDVPFITGMPGWSSALLDTPARDGLVKNLFVAQNFPAFADNDELAKDLRAEFPDAPITIPTSLGYAAVMVFVEALETACASDDLTRKGVLEAFRSLESSDARGHSVENDYTILDQSTSRDSIVLGVNPDVDGGLSTLTTTPYTAEADIASYYGE
ncbi:ABC transporter substrate-binding protein [Nocardioides pacificus]